MRSIINNIPLKSQFLVHLRFLFLESPVSQFIQQYRTHSMMVKLDIEANVQMDS